MLSLLPTENWEYKLSDIFRGLTAALGSMKQSETFFIDGLGNCIPVRSARVAFVAAIRALDLRIPERASESLSIAALLFFKRLKQAVV